MFPRHVTRSLVSKQLQCSSKILLRMEKFSTLPPENRGMMKLDKTAFTRSIKVPSLIVEQNKLRNISSILSKYFLKMVHIKPVQDFASNTDNGNVLKQILLNPERIREWSQLGSEVIKHLEEHGIQEENFKYDTTIDLNYDNWNASDILKMILPKDQDVSSSYSTVGHIIHLNLREHLVPYKYIISEVLLDKIKAAKTVVNKINKIDNTFRNFQMEVIGGENNMMAHVKENKCSYVFDFSMVYWNPRLSTEHERIVGLLESGDVLFDVFCGVGPFSIPAAQKLCIVHANDLNPESFKWLNHNVKINNIKPGKITTYNKDAAEFIKTDIKQVLLSLWSGSPEVFEGKIHITMNLPALALEFLQYFKNLCSSDELVKTVSRTMPTIHVYFFVTCEPILDLKEVTAELFEKTTGYEIKEYSIHFVRNVSTKKNMMRVSFPVPESFLIKEENVTSDEPPKKKFCLD